MAGHFASTHGGAQPVMSRSLWAPPVAGHGAPILEEDRLTFTLFTVSTSLTQRQPRLYYVDPEQNLQDLFRATPAAMLVVRDSPVARPL
ncbi:MAG: hypothetical protein U0931_14725 [Vulcanimicrobiota bacterium]